MNKSFFLLKKTKPIKEFFDFLINNDLSLNKTAACTHLYIVIKKNLYEE